MHCRSSVETQCSKCLLRTVQEPSYNSGNGRQAGREGFLEEVELPGLLAHFPPLLASCPDCIQATFTGHSSPGPGMGACAQVLPSEGLGVWGLVGRQESLSPFLQDESQDLVPDSCSSHVFNSLLRVPQQCTGPGFLHISYLFSPA